MSTLLLLIPHHMALYYVSLLLLIPHHMAFYHVDVTTTDSPSHGPLPCRIYYY